ncbi:P-loop containing nucleoside triphosphate hydrolase protein [Lojkania enalia]|uniref:P-loop containing nucleoside triphosphate hydrolase protein n=1 Tax=Lojkania enalia TaxID=147567 RepID=A0A9P4N4D6_9PLEO|nr:P-loop containing nucleoside triphosphate hydrolase protein [Didymosphaeria enalia]
MPTDSKEKLATPGSKASIHYLYEDPLGINRWSTTFPERVGPPAEDAKSAQHALVVRYRLSTQPDKVLDLHSIVVQSPHLKKMLAQVLDEYPGITLELERVEFNAPFECFVHRWEKLKAARDKAKQQLDNSDQTSDNLENPAQHMELLYSILEEDLAALIREKRDLVKNGVMKFKYMWTIFEPGCLVYHNIEGRDRLYKLVSGKQDTRNGNQLYKLECQFVDFDGTQFGMNKETLYIAGFRGTKTIAKLEAFPLEFHSDLEELKKKLTKRGRMFEAYKGYHFVSYYGIALAKGPRGQMKKYNVNGRIIVDASSWAQYGNLSSYSRSSSKVSLEYIETVDYSEEVASTKSQNKTDEDSEDDVVVLDEYIGKREVRGIGKRPTVNGKTKSILTNEQLLLAIPTVRGYSLHDRKWLDFYIDNIRDIEWNNDAFKYLVAPQDQKNLILAFAESQAKYRDHFDDFIQGKGKGIIMLLTGPPGVGKTLTAESVAESMKAPLYSIGAADLGSKPDTLEKELHDILEMCAKWNAVLLLDEADVFMEARSTTDLNRNKLVAVFLRLLEYFEGILFLTTNRIENMDAAFESRIHLTLNYNELDKVSRRHIWQIFLDRSFEAQHSNIGAFTDAELDRLAKAQLNGRQIKNTLKIAQLLASKQDECLGMSHLETVLNLRKANEKRKVSFFSGD